MKSIISTILLCLSISTQAAPLDIKQQLNELGVLALTEPQLVKNGLYEVMTNQGLLYTDETGELLIHGSVIDTKTKENLTDLAMKRYRLELLSVYADTTITYPANNPTYSITVFSDIHCPYCQQFHQSIPELNANNITVQYMAMPSSSVSAQQMSSAWCSKLPALTLDLLFNQQTIATSTCGSTPVQEHLQLARALGFNGTPTIVLPDGSVIPQAVTPSQLLQALQTHSIK